MNGDAVRFPFTAANDQLGEAGLRPFLPLTFAYQDRTLSASGLLDTGAMVNVLPYHLGVALGARWEQQDQVLHLTGNLAQYEAKVLLVTAVVANFEPVPFAFAWSQAENVPLILGQVNFFLKFDVCFYRTQLAFDVRLVA